jgi:pilus assembly protein CpaE
MASEQIRVGILAPSAETREQLRAQINATGLASLELEAEQYCSAYGDRLTRRFVDLSPDVILVDMQDPQAAIQSLHILHAALPEAWLFVSSPDTDPQLIIESMRAGAREYLPKPIPARSLSLAFSRFVAENQRHRETAGLGKIYPVIAAKGGAGATSVAINIATCLSQVSKTRVALVDLCDPVGDVSVQLNLKPQFTVSDALAAASRLDSVLLDSFVSRAGNLAVLPGPKEFRPEQVPGSDTVAKLLEVIAGSYTHSIIDLPPSLGNEQLQVVTQMAAGVVVVLPPELPALWRAERLLRFLSACGGTEKLRVVINRCHRGSPIGDAEISKALGHPVYWRLPNNYRASIQAINSGQPLVAFNHSELASSYRQLAHNLTELSPPQKGRRFGLFS